MKTKKAIDIILKDIRKNGISHTHRKAEINPDCPECKVRLLEGFLLWYKDLSEWYPELTKKARKNGYIGEFGGYTLKDI